MLVEVCVIMDIANLVYPFIKDEDDNENSFFPGSD